MKHMENKQTAVEWLFKMLWDEPKDKLNWYAFLKKAKEMEAEQLNQACYDGYYQEEHMDTREYYNNTYGKHSQKKS